MWSGNQFEDKANRLMNRLGSIQKVNNNRSREDGEWGGQPVSQLKQIQQEIESSQGISQNKLILLNQNIHQLSSTIKAQNENRLKIDENFTLTLQKVEKNMRNILQSINKVFNDRESKLANKIEALIKAEKKEMDDENTEAEDLLENIGKFQKKVLTIVQEVNLLKKSRLEFQDRISKQFSEQIRQLKKILEGDIKGRQQNQSKSLQTLRVIYKQSMQGILGEERQRQQNEKMLILVVEEMINQILQF